MSLIRSRSVSAEVGAYVERLIDTTLAPGDRLPPERELAARLHVSRSTVREAMSHLELRRRIVRTPGRGTTVLPRPEASVELKRKLVLDAYDRVDVAELRMVIEPQIAGLAAARATDSNLVLLERTLADSHAGLTPIESLELDVRFHTEIAASAGNSLLISLCEITNTWVRDVRARSHRTRTGRRSSIEWHRKIYGAIASHDAEAATQAMADHLNAVAKLIGEMA